MISSRTKNSIFALTLALTLAFVSPTKTMAWGDKGHIIVAHIAYKLLSNDARTEVNKLLGEDETLETVATWPDSLRGSFDHPGIRPETPLWHFVDIPLNEEYDPIRDCAEAPNGSCAISALVIFQEVLAEKKSGYYANSRYEALKFLVHFAGDIHQPLHCVDDHNDHGGNLKKVVWIDSTTSNLHSVWDNAILSENMNRQNIISETAYAEFLFSTLSSQQKLEAKAFPSTTPTTVRRQVIEDWAKAAHVIANDAYSDIGPLDTNHRYKLTTVYYDHHKQQVDDQLKRAGVHLARILNENLR
jgi:hypothetical protein